MKTFSLGDVLGVTGSLLLSNVPYSGQQVTYRIYKQGVMADTATQFTDIDGESIVAFNTSQYTPGVYKLEAEWVNDQKPLKAYIDFELREEGVLLVLKANAEDYTSGQIIELNCSVLTPLGEPKVGVTIKLIDSISGKQWTSVTNSLGIAQVKINTGVNDEQQFIFQAYFGSAESNQVKVSVTPKLELELRANSSIYNAGDQGIFTATLTKGDKPYPNQAIEFTVE